VPGCVVSSSNSPSVTSRGSVRGRSGDVDDYVWIAHALVLAQTKRLSASPRSASVCAAIQTQAPFASTCCGFACTTCCTTGLQRIELMEFEPYVIRHSSNGRVTLRGLLNDVVKIYSPQSTDSSLTYWQLSF